MTNNNAAYRRILVAFMKYNDDMEYSDDHVFTPQDLGAVTAKDLVEYFNFRAYGTHTPTEDDRPINVRSSSLLYWKKAISYFMPNKNHQWNELTGRGNPTKSQELNDMIKKVKKFEVRGQGAPSRARRALKEHEFRSMQSELRSSDDYITKYGIPALNTFQFHLIGRVDDCCKWRREHLAVHDSHSDKACKVRLAWSKNVTDERAAPWQTMLGCMDWVFCSILNVGLWLEMFHSTTPDGRLRPFVFGFSEELQEERQENAASQAKARVYRALRPIFNMMGIEIDSTNVGTHSTRKFASTHARSHGVSKDDKDHRGRWKAKRVSDVYDEVQLDFVDAKVAEVLCPGGACNYVVVDEACTPQWICEHVTPSITEVFGHQVGYLFGKALLWLAHSEHCNHMPEPMCHAIREAYTTVHMLPEGNNPIQKRLLAITGGGAQVFMEDIGGNDKENPQAPPAQGNNTPNHDNLNGQSNRQLLLSLMNQMSAVRNSITQQGSTMEVFRATLTNQKRTLRSLVRRLDANPLHQLQRANQRARAGAEPRSPPRALQVDGHIDPRAVLQPSIRTLQGLWEEYIHGIGHNKPAKYFTSGERGRRQTKFKYSRRKIFWTLVERLVARGHSSHDVIARIYTAYGPRSPTDIINAIRNDKRNNTLPFMLR